MMDIEKVAHMLVVNSLLRQGYDPAHVKLEVVADAAMKLLAEFTCDELMAEWRRRLQ